jgi:hypothetical protein
MWRISRAVVPRFLIAGHLDELKITAVPRCLEHRFSDVVIDRVGFATLESDVCGRRRHVIAL